MTAETKPSPTKRASRAKSKAIVHPPKPEVIPQTAIKFASGDRVSHGQFGDGQVTSVQDDKLTIAFEKAGTKIIVDDFVKRRR